ncbi:leucyl aminopeptidase [Brevundimonas bullata]|uniref:Probable cytosol aminopeptidase n=1 Tax=Brevundimonas bullata TaxID=13160 RepID=A0A7W7IM66_9CAUL|nr:leucyl aminopeptidase [Brevundimonas bullata]MBB4796919.1 leucyl aminopeptidase [Brevundimonas bullata]MBB6381878.1 leucyl aminopeptidase [Brevundimonas bullata]
MRRTKNFPTFAAAAALAAVSLSVAMPAEAQSRRAASAEAPASLTPRAAPAVQRAVTFAATPGQASGALVLPLGAEADLATRGAALSPAVREAIAAALTAARFDYKARQTLSLHGVGGWDRILIVGLPADAKPADSQTAGTVVGRALIAQPGAMTVLTAGLSADSAAELAAGLGLGQYRSDLHRTTGRDAAAPGGIIVVADDVSGAQAAWRRGAALVEAMAWTRDVSNEPANVIYPESFVERARAAFAGLPGVEIEVLDVPAMQALGMGSLLGVGQGSARPPRLLVVRYKGRGAPEAGPIALLGKGITFDSGGISIKPGANMGNMKMDMSGAASVVGAVLALAKAGAPVDVAAVAALAENMPDANAIRPGDVLTAMNGKTIEVISTDAEGRLVLADAVVWADTRLNPAAIVDVATLTGSVGGALGNDYAGLFSRHDALADQLKTAGDATGERLWRLPLHPSYAGATSSPIADIKNSGEGGAGAGTGAHFIGYFARPETPWAHLDIANMAYGGASDVKPAGSAGFSVRLLERFVRDFQPVAKVKGTGGF